MNKKLLIALLLLVPPAFAGGDNQWVLEQCTLTYHGSHPLHQTEGVSHAARGKGCLPRRTMRFSDRGTGQAACPGRLSHHRRACALLLLISCRERCG